MACAAGSSPLPVPDHANENGAYDDSQHPDHDPIAISKPLHRALSSRQSTPTLTFLSAYWFLRRSRNIRPARTANAATVNTLNAASPVNRPPI